MFTMINDNSRKLFSAFAAVAIVGFMGLTFDQGHTAAAPRGVVELGELSPVGEAQIATVMLPELIVTGSRLEANPAELPMLAEVVVLGQRETAVAATAQAKRHGAQG